MSYQAVQWALYQAPMLLTASGKPDTAARFVLVARAERADEKGCNSYAGPGDVVRATGFDERTIQRAEKRLEAAGLLVRDGFSRLGTVRWTLNMDQVTSGAGEAVAEERLERRRKLDAERQRRLRERRKGADVTDAESVTEPVDDRPSIEPDVSTKIRVTDAESVTSRTQNPDVTDAAPPKPPMNHPPKPPTGGTLPPDPLRPQPPTASGAGTAEQNSLSDSLTPAQDQEGESLPHARGAREPGPSDPQNVIPFVARAADPRRRARDQGRAELSAKAQDAQAGFDAILARRQTRQETS